MILRWLLASLLSAVLLMAWGFVLWTKTPIMTKRFKTADDDEALRKTLKKQLPESGTYLLPWYDEEEHKKDPQKVDEDFKKEHAEGPLVQIIYKKEGTDPMHWTVYAQGFAHSLVTSLLVGLLLVMATPSLRYYLARVAFVVVVAVFAVILVQFEGPIWFHQPWEYPLARSWTSVIGWVLPAMAMAAIIRHKES